MKFIDDDEDKYDEEEENNRVRGEEEYDELPHRWLSPPFLSRCLASGYESRQRSVVVNNNNNCHSSLFNLYSEVIRYL